MGICAFVDDGVLMTKSFVEKDICLLKNYISSHHKDYSFCIMENNEYYCYDIVKNNPLTEIYNFNCYVVKFAFSSIDTLHDESQEKVLQKLLEQLKKETENINGYFNIRIPCHLSDLIVTFNSLFYGKDLQFCGGTIEQLHTGSDLARDNNDDIVKVSFVELSNDTSTRRKLIDIAEKGFTYYQGQYHISRITSTKAKDIYVNWIQKSIIKNDLLLIATFNDEIAGFVTVKLDGNIYEGLLSSVDTRFRGKGIYKTMISYLIKYANNNDGFFISSTQIDNYIVQRTWSSLGMKTLYSIFNFHLNKLK